MLKAWQFGEVKSGVQRRPISNIAIQKKQNSVAPLCCCAVVAVAAAVAAGGRGWTDGQQGDGRTDSRAGWTDGQQVEGRTDGQVR